MKFFNIEKCSRLTQAVLKVLVLSALFSGSGVSVAGEEDVVDKVEEQDSDSVLGNVREMADNAQRATTDRFNRFVLSVDGFFGSADSGTNEANESWGRLRVDGVEPADEAFEIKARLKIRVVLPQAERRLRLLFSTEDADVNASSSQSSIDTDADDQNVALALRFVRTLNETINLKFDVGARVRDRKGQVFGRISASNVMQLPFGVEQQITNNLFLFSASGYQNQLTFDIRKPINELGNVFVRSSTSILAENGIPGAEINETLGFYTDLSSRTAIAVEALFNYETSRDDEFNANFQGSEYRVRFRQNIWRPWFFYEIWPTVSFPVSTDFQREFGGRIRIEMLFGQF